jgi:hypothetical protein
MPSVQAIVHAALELKPMLYVLLHDSPEPEALRLWQIGGYFGPAAARRLRGGRDLIWRLLSNDHRLA